MTAVEARRMTENNGTIAVAPTVNTGPIESRNDLAQQFRRYRQGLLAGGSDGHCGVVERFEQRTVECSEAREAIRLVEN